MWATESKGDGGGSGDGGNGVQPRAGIPPPWLDGVAGTGLEWIDNRSGEEEGPHKMLPLNMQDSGEEEDEDFMVIRQDAGAKEEDRKNKIQRETQIGFGDGRFVEDEDVLLKMFKMKGLVGGCAKNG
ncbi:hypothetical protein QVD17_09273 [Tagetes erecta]|uniref:Uncharacterized protein n=1 Tax=Tagetes erecta TaxID=13708 RepID=A0AAD8P552_TARER|nr:hypothetical protein QVD17_09273 [Tagetes erecta]